VVVKTTLKVAFIFLICTIHVNKHVLQNQFSCKYVIIMYRK